MVVLRGSGGLLRMRLRNTGLALGLDDVFWLIRCFSCTILQVSVSAFVVYSLP